MWSDFEIYYFLFLKLTLEKLLWVKCPGGGDGRTIIAAVGWSVFCSTFLKLLLFVPCFC